MNLKDYVLDSPWMGWYNGDWGDRWGPPDRCLKLRMNTFRVHRIKMQLNGREDDAWWIVEVYEELGWVLHEGKKHANNNKNR